jgi:hypothetical protein
MALANGQDAGRRPSNLSSSLAPVRSLLQCPAMNIATMLAELKAEHDQLARAITALEHVAGSGNRASKAGKRTMSASARRKIADAQRARWAKLK